MSNALFLDVDLRPREDGAASAAVAGRISNRTTLLDSLGLPADSTDPALVLAARARHGDAFVERLEGLFALVVHDPPRAEVLVARGRLGVVPCYVSLDPSTGDRAGQLVVSELLPPLLKARRRATTLDRQGLHEHLAEHGVLSTRTLFEGVRRVPPGSSMRVDLTTGGATTRAFWAVRFDPIERSDERCAAEFGEHLDRAVAASEDVDWSYLSSGRDCSSLVLSSRRVRGRAPGTITATFDRVDYEESGVDEFVRHFGLEAPHKAQIDLDQWWSTLPRTVRALGLPPMDTGKVCEHLAAIAAAERGDRVFSGNGGDEFWGGYAPQHLAGLAEEVIGRRRPSALRHLRPRHAARFAYFALAGARRGGRNVGLYAPMPAGPWTALRPPWRPTDPTAPWAPLDPLRTDRSLSAAERVFVAYIARGDPAFGQEYLLHRDAGVEAVLPYCDDAFVAFSLTVPRAQLVRALTIKHVQRLHLLREVPPAMLDRPKKGFPTPAFPWHRADGFARLTEFWNTKGTPLFEEVFDSDRIRGLVRRLRRHRADTIASYELATRLHALRGLRIWFDEFAEHLS